MWWHTIILISIFVLRERHSCVAQKQLWSQAQHNILFPRNIFWNFPSSLWAQQLFVQSLRRGFTLTHANTHAQQHGSYITHNRERTYGTVLYIHRTHIRECDRVQHTMSSRDSKEEAQRRTDKVRHGRATADSASESSIQEMKQRWGQYFNELLFGTGGKKYLQWSDAKCHMCQNWGKTNISQVTIRSQRVQPSE